MSPRPLHCAALLGALALAAAEPTATVRLEPQSLGPSQGYMPLPLVLSPVRPPQVVREPAYKGTPLYGFLRLGNGPRATFLVVLDRPEQGDDRIFVDRNQNGDLTDDGDGAWDRRTDKEGMISYRSDLPLRASYGTSTEERSGAPYGVAIYTAKGREGVAYYPTTKRVGTLTLDGREWAAELRELDGDALYRKPAATPGEARRSRPVSLVLTRPGPEGKPERAILDIRGPFKVLDRAYEAEVAEDGSSLTLRPTTRPVEAAPPPPPPQKKLLAAGTPAPDYGFELWGGKPARLSDYRGRVVILDFWATWCGPCQQSMPHVEELYRALKGQPVEVLAVCVWDTRTAYDRWVPANRAKYTFPLAFDNSGRGAGSQATGLWNVGGIPTTYIIDREGRVAEALVGYEKGDRRIEAALRKLGIKVD